MKMNFICSKRKLTFSKRNLIFSKRKLNFSKIKLNFSKRKLIFSGRKLKFSKKKFIFIRRKLTCKWYTQFSHKCLRKLHRKVTYREMLNNEALGSNQLCFHRLTQQKLLSTPLSHLNSTFSRKTSV